MTFDSTITVALVGLAGTLLAGLIGFLTARLKAVGPEARASAKLSEAQAADLLIENLSEQYQQAMTRLAAVEARLSILDRRFALAQGIVAGLPEEHRTKFDPVFAPLGLPEIRGV